MEDGSTILLIEDDPDINTIVLLALEATGYRVVVGTGMVQALALLTAAPIALILAAPLRRPGTGESAERWAGLEQIREHAPAIPIVIFTAANADDFAGYRARGFSDLLLKPFSIDQLINIVRRNLRQPLHQILG